MKLVTVKLTHNQLTEQFEYFGETETIDPCFEGVLNIFPLPKGIKHEDVTGIYV